MQPKLWSIKYFLIFKFYYKIFLANYKNNAIYWIVIKIIIKDQSNDKNNDWIRYRYCKIKM